MSERLRKGGQESGSHEGEKEGGREREGGKNCGRRVLKGGAGRAVGEQFTVQN